MASPLQDQGLFMTSTPLGVILHWPDTDVTSPLEDPLSTHGFGDHEELTFPDGKELTPDGTFTELVTNESSKSHDPAQQVFSTRWTFYPPSLFKKAHDDLHHHCVVAKIASTTAPMRDITAMEDPWPVLTSEHINSIYGVQEQAMEDIDDTCPAFNPVSEDDYTKMLYFAVVMDTKYKLAYCKQMPDESQPDYNTDYGKRRLPTARLWHGLTFGQPDDG
ncbi:hypothetical protein HU200_023570 [Digitaria exilis]|uniref:Uncharacterized protein n=1 Tax=Digitaria exilis TaxID=1010633 RepID=A0A835EU77_9POAL|nr:hypothetical protein HU200_023570 [Digitaria exilis]